MRAGPRIIGRIGGAVDLQSPFIGAYMAPPVGRTSILTAESLGRRLDNGWIWRGLDLDLASGERAVLTGRSGTGKSLLLRTLCGLDRPDEGRATTTSAGGHRLLAQGGATSMAEKKPRKRSISLRGPSAT